MLNPFIRAEGGLPPKLTYTNEHNVQVEVDSWEFELSRKINARFPGIRQMFFPQALYRALNENTIKGKVGRSVLLLGEQGVGKSVLATMAIRRGTWNARDPKSGGIIRGDSFIYVSPSESAAEVHALAADHGRATNDDQSPRVRSTEARLRNIRSLFLRISNMRPELKSSAPEIGDTEWFSALLKKTLLSSEKTGRVPLPPSSALMFYDVAGEQARRNFDDNVTDLLHRADRFAVLIDAEDLSAFGGPRAGGLNSLRIARKWMTELDRRDRCLVVTKIDRVREREGRELAVTDNNTRQVWNEWRGQLNGETLRQYLPGKDAESKLLAKLLENSKDPYERDLLQEITGPNPCPVHFVWTEGIDSENGTMAYPVGLHRFVLDWCFEGISIVAH